MIYVYGMSIELSLLKYLKLNSMKKLLNYKISPHFEERIRQRHIDLFLVSLCLTKGKMEYKKKKKIKFTLSKEKIKEAINLGYISISECIGVESLIVVVRNNILITAFAKYADTGINLPKLNVNFKNLNKNEYQFI